MVWRMASLGLEGPYLLTAIGVASAVTRTSAGIFLLGYTDSYGQFKTLYVGRSDTDIGKGLRRHLGGYKEFKFEYFVSPKRAFEKQCHLYHDLGETALDNKVHPARPVNVRWTCPRCRAFG